MTDPDHLEVDAMKELYTTELSGEVFYNAIADRVSDERAAELLRRNGREEAGHARRLGRALTIKLGTPFEPTAEMLTLPPLGLPEPLDPVRFLRRLVQGELDGDLGYQRWADNEPDPEVERLLRLNGREESIHSARVTEAIAILTST
ncbi:MAG TPA: ferritin-like domain-containing protein [Acidimicrobiales bacterium]